ncbi:MAG: SPOR domain-containing protein [Steroidobacteraceae bacterium]
MDVRIRERLIGSLVLVAVIVLLVPAILKGPGTATRPAPAPESRSVEIPVDDAAGPAENDVLVPEPEILAKPAAPAPEAEKTAEQAPPPAGTASLQSTQQSAWAVQLGAFSSRGKADELVARLRSRGYSAFVLEYRAGGQLLHRVRVGPEQERARAVAIAERLRNDGFQPVVAPHP